MKRSNTAPRAKNPYMRSQNRGNLKNTTVKGAYKPQRKKQINKRMRPMDEIKNRIQSVIATATALRSGIHRSR